MVATANREADMAKITHIALAANPAHRIAIQETGVSAEAAIAAAVQATGAKAEDFVAMPVTPRMGMVLAGGDTPIRWTEVDGVADLHDDDYKPAWFVFSGTAGEDDEDRQLFEKLQEASAVEAETAADAILTVLAGFYDHVGWPGDATYVAVEVPAGTLFDDVFVEVVDDVYRLAEVYEVANWCSREVDEEDWDEFIFERDGVPGEDEEDQVSLINVCRTYDDELRLITDSPIRLNGVTCAVVNVYRRHDATTYAFERKAYPKIRAGQHHMGARALLTAVLAEIERIELDL